MLYRVAFLHHSLIWGRIFSCRRKLLDSVNEIDDVVPGVGNDRDAFVDHSTTNDDNTMAFDFPDDGHSISELGVGESINKLTPAVALSPIVERNNSISTLARRSNSSAPQLRPAVQPLLTGKVDAALLEFYNGTGTLSQQIETGTYNIFRSGQCHCRQSSTNLVANKTVRRSQRQCIERRWCVYAAVAVSWCNAVSRVWLCCAPLW